MNNLELVSVKGVSLPALNGTVSGLEIEDNAYYLIINHTLFKIESDGANHIVPSAHPLLKGVLYNSLEEKLFVCDGFYFYYHLDRQNFVRIQCPTQLSAYKYSPMQDKIAYLDAYGGVVICNINVADSVYMQEFAWSLNDAVPLQLNVNWGTAATQFAGFDNTTLVDTVRDAIGRECTDQQTEIVWRPDGKFFLVAFSSEGKRRFKIFSTAKGVVAQNEDIPGLHAPVCWRLTHNMITAACCSDNVWRLIVFEGSGYAKMVINLKEQAPILQLLWSPNDEILAVVQEGTTACYVTLITVGNYTFEVKQELVFKEQVRYVQWRLPVNGSQNLVVITNSSAVHYFFHSTIMSSGIYVNGASTAAVINDRHVALINFESFVLPPPYKQFEFASAIRFSNVINRVVFNVSKPTMLCMDCHNNCYVYNYGGNVPMLLTENGGFVLPGDETFPLNAHHIGFFDDILVIYISEGNKEKAIRYNLVTRSIMSVMNIRPDMSGAKFIKTDVSLQECLQFSNGDFLINGKLSNNFPNGVKKTDKIIYDGIEYMFILGNNGLFLCNGKFIANNVVSFVLFSQYVLFTTSDQKLLSSRLNVLGDHLLNSQMPHLCFDCRMIEEGGTLVVGVASKLAAILQMPRGNIEMVSTDLLGIDSVNSLVSMGRWEFAITETKLRQLNLNILVDLNIDRFIRNTYKFVTAQSAGNLIDFILGLTDFNVIKRMHCHFQFSHMDETPQKINWVCTKLLEEMEKLNLGKYIEVIMIARVKTMGLQNAINYAQNVYTQRNLDVNKVVEKGLRAITRYWNPEDVSAACLKTYDLDFMMFAHFAYKQDPQLTSMLIDTFSDSCSEDEKKFKVNNYLGDYRAATTYYAMHMLQVAEREIKEFSFNQLIDYALAHQELEVLYKFLRQNGVSVPRLCFELGNYLVAINRDVDAAEKFAEAGDFEDSLALYVNNFKWKEAVYVITLMNLNPNEEMRRLEMLADHFDAVGRYEGASAIYVKLHMYSKAVDSCIRVHSFGQAIILANNFDPNLKEYIKMYLQDYVTSIEDLIYRSKNEIMASTDRIKTIWEDRIVAARKPITADSSEYEMANEYAESVNTGASSGRSSGTTSSRRTRKEQRRYVDLKVGGPYEDIAIMRTVHNKITELCKMKEEVDQIINALLDYEEHLKAESLKISYGEMLEVFRNCAAQIWFPGLNTPMEGLNDKLVAARKNLDLIDDKYLNPPFVHEF